jgi:hypothetical protein
VAGHRVLLADLLVQAHFLRTPDVPGGDGGGGVPDDGWRERVHERFLGAGEAYDKDIIIYQSAAVKGEGFEPPRIQEF